MRVLTRLRKLAFYLRELRNWPAVAAMHVTGRPVRRLRLRDGHVIHLLDPRHEIWAFDAIYRARCYDVDFPGLPTDGTVVDLGANVGIFTQGDLPTPVDIQAVKQDGTVAATFHYTLNEAGHTGAFAQIPITPDTFPGIDGDAMSIRVKALSGNPVGAYIVTVDQISTDTVFIQGKRVD